MSQKPPLRAEGLPFAALSLRGQFTRVLLVVWAAAYALLFCWFLGSLQ